MSVDGDENAYVYRVLADPQTSLPRDARGFANSLGMLYLADRPVELKQQRTRTAAEAMGISGNWAQGIRLADAEGVPAYIVFSDAVLRGMAAHSPQTREALAQISGVGPVKLERYGEAFLAELTKG